MGRLKQLVLDQNLVKADNLQSPNSKATYNGYMTRDGVKCGWGTQVWPDGGRYEGEW